MPPHEEPAEHVLYGLTVPAEINDAVLARLSPESEYDPYGVVVSRYLVSQEIQVDEDGVPEDPVVTWLGVNLLNAAVREAEQDHNDVATRAVVVMLDQRYGPLLARQSPTYVARRESILQSDVRSRRAVRADPPPRPGQERVMAHERPSLPPDGQLRRFYESGAPDGTALSIWRDRMTMLANEITEHLHVSGRHDIEFGEVMQEAMLLLENVRVDNESWSRRGCDLGRAQDKTWGAIFLLDSYVNSLDELAAQIMHKERIVAWDADAQGMQPNAKVAAISGGLNPRSGKVWVVFVAANGNVRRVPATPLDLIRWQEMRERGVRPDVSAGHWRFNPPAPPARPRPRPAADPPEPGVRDPRRHDPHADSFRRRPTPDPVHRQESERRPAARLEVPEYAMLHDAVGGSRQNRFGVAEQLVSFFESGGRLPTPQWNAALLLTSDLEGLRLDERSREGALIRQLRGFMRNQRDYYQSDFR